MTVPGEEFRFLRQAKLFLTGRITLTRIRLINFHPPFSARHHRKLMLPNSTVTRSNHIANRSKIGLHKTLHLIDSVFASRFSLFAS